MEDIIHMRLLFVAGVLGMAGVMALLATAVVRLRDWVRARAERPRPSVVVRQAGKNIPARGTR